MFGKTIPCVSLLAMLSDQVRADERAWGMERHRGEAGTANVASGSREGLNDHRAGKRRDTSEGTRVRRFPWTWVWVGYHGTNFWYRPPDQQTTIFQDQYAS